MSTPQAKNTTGEDVVAGLRAENSRLSGRIADLEIIEDALLTKIRNMTKASKPSSKATKKTKAKKTPKQTKTRKKAPKTLESSEDEMPAKTPATATKKRTSGVSAVSSGRKKQKRLKTSSSEDLKISDLIFDRTVDVGGLSYAAAARRCTVSCCAVFCVLFAAA